ncbi:hypothetical protein BO70DRAFT_359227 [Aspergillus heteromorphus CBS 117.55]|uniref:Cupin type-2 domain-containing protein n=1 Tax=Aspergillus heteromorphus CBS 117.55 TaxID=1448321 RepID=A0A317WZU1_9EURO|nr:uncharacterized protein BO70DRAFT_359227 [Aspergillus heteromorphus CBS 117.55]PWY90248.1 hypothetical protein BO70DRAFT_359227 [Aspergillus heteromorphus CBS 117.55]
MADTPLPLPNPNRYITENAPDGNSFFSTAVDESLPVLNDLRGALIRLGYTTDPPPAALSHPTDVARYAASLADPPPLVPLEGGAHVWYIDTPPGGESPLHRTVSLDLVIVLAGDVELNLSGGEQRRLRPGDLVVQRATLHKWRNLSSTQWSRMIGIVSACQPVETPSGPLGETFLSP